MNKAIHNGDQSMGDIRKRRGKKIARIAINSQAHTGNMVLGYSNAIAAGDAARQKMMDALDNLPPELQFLPRTEIIRIMRAAVDGRE
jgi:geranylgeranyl pyrophosphate synthase